MELTIRLALWSGLLLLGLALPAQAHNGAVAIAVPVAGIRVDGELSDWPASMRRYPIALPESGIKPRDTEDFQGFFRLGYSAQEGALYVAVEVQDESGVIDDSRASGADVGVASISSDGCEVYLALAHQKGEEPAAQWVIWGTARRSFGAARLEDAQVEVRGGEAGSVYEWRLDLRRMGEELLPVVIGFDVVVADKDADGSFSWMAWGRETGKVESADRLGDVLLVENPAALGSLSGKVLRKSDGAPFPQATIRIDDARRDLWVQAITSEDGRYEVPVPPGSYRVFVVRAEGADSVDIAIKANEHLQDLLFTPSRITPADTTLYMRLQQPRSSFILPEWKFHEGDDPAWAAPGYEDSSWESAESAPYMKYIRNTGNLYNGVLPHRDWRGIGWFRRYLSLDSLPLREVPLALKMEYQAGASELYLDGELIYASGKVGPSPAQEVAFWERNPRIVTLNGQTSYLIAMRYSNYSVRPEEYGGFGLVLMGVDNAIRERLAEEKEEGDAKALQLAYTLLPLAFTLLHLFLFAFYPAARENLYYAVFTGLLAATVYSSYETSLMTVCVPVLSEGPVGLPPPSPGSYSFIAGILRIVLLLYTLRFLYVVFDVRSWFFWFFTIFFGAGIVSSVSGLDRLLMDKPFFTGIYVAVFVSYVIHILLVIQKALVNKKEGAWLIGLGFLGFVFIFLFVVFAQSTPPSVLAWAMMSPLVSMSISLAHKIARTNKNLEMQLVRVEELSAKTVEQERALRAEAEKELQTAHEMQMALMPKAPPQIQGFEITGRCTPANHVGGDLFQYFHQHGRLSISLADVTGHAMEAAIPVVMFSGILKSQMETGGTVEELFRRLNRSLHGTLTGRTFVCLAMGELEPGSRRFRFSNSGCPYPYHYRAATGEVSELRVDAYPLGIRPDSTYRAIEVQLAPGDRVVFCSDGIIEATNAAGEMFGFERTAEVICQGCGEDLSAEGLLARLMGEVKGFRRETPQGDDQTVVVLKVER